MIKKIGIIGAGHVVEDGHLPVLKNIKEARAAWIFDTNVERSKLLSRMYQVPFLSKEKALEALEWTDLCLLAVPLGVRKDYLESCAQAGVAVYSEKPFARTKTEHQYFCSLFPDYKLAVGLQRRFFKSTQIVKEIIKSKIFGYLRRVELNQGQYSLKTGGAGRYITDPHLSGGGVVIDSGIHSLDQILFSTDAQRVEVKTARAIAFNGIDYETRILSILTMEEGYQLEVSCNYSALRNFQNGFKYFFDTAEVEFGLYPDSEVTTKPLNGMKGNINFEISDLNLNKPTATTSHQSYYLSWSYFLKGILEKCSQITSPAASYLTTGWIEDIYNKVLS